MHQRAPPNSSPIWSPLQHTGSFSEEVIRFPMTCFSIDDIDTVLNYAHDPIQNGGIALNLLPVLMKSKRDSLRGKLDTSQPFSYVFHIFSFIIHSMETERHSFSPNPPPQIDIARVNSFSVPPVSSMRVLNGRRQARQHRCSLGLPDRRPEVRRRKLLIFLEYQATCHLRLPFLRR